MTDRRRPVTVTREEAAQIDWVETLLIVQRARQTADNQRLVLLPRD